MNGNFGYVKTKRLTDREYKRTAMQDNDFTSKVPDMSNSIEITDKVLKDEKLDNFDARKNTTQDIISQIIAKEKFTVNLNLKDVNANKEYLERFVIEIKPRLKEIGADLVVTNNNILSSTFLAENEL